MEFEEKKPLRKSIPFCNDGFFAMESYHVAGTLDYSNRGVNTLPDKICRTVLQYNKELFYGGDMPGSCEHGGMRHDVAESEAENFVVSFGGYPVCFIVKRYMYYI